MSKLNYASTKLDTAWKRLRQQWEAAKTMWLDTTQQEFEEHYSLPLERQVQATQRELGKLVDVVSQAEQKVK